MTLFSVLIFFAGTTPAKVSIQEKKTPDNFKIANNNQKTNAKDYQDLTLEKLPSSKEILNNNETGKTDPFSSRNFSGEGFNLISLLGVFSANNKIYAIIKYDENIFEVEPGLIGGKSSELLPKGIKVISIDIEEPSMAIEYKNKIVKIIGKN